MVRLLGGLAITVMTLYSSPRARTGRGRGREGGGLYPELAAYRISEGSSPNVQAEVGRQVALLPIEQARAELARHGLELDEKAVRRVAHELGSQMLATRTRDLLRFRRGELPAGGELAGKRVAVALDGGRVRVRTVIKKVRVGGRIKEPISRHTAAPSGWPIARASNSSITSSLRPFLSDRRSRAYRSVRPSGDRPDACRARLR